MMRGPGGERATGASLPRRGRQWPEAGRRVTGVPGPSVTSKRGRRRNGALRGRPATPLWCGPALPCALQRIFAARGPWRAAFGTRRRPGARPAAPQRAPAATPRCRAPLQGGPAARLPCREAPPHAAPLARRRGPGPGRRRVAGEVGQKCPGDGTKVPDRWDKSVRVNGPAQGPDGSGGYVYVWGHLLNSIGRYHAVCARGVCLGPREGGYP